MSDSVKILRIKAAAYDELKELACTKEYEEIVMPWIIDVVKETEAKLNRNP